MLCVRHPTTYLIENSTALSRTRWTSHLTDRRWKTSDGLCCHQSSPIRYSKARKMMRQSGLYSTRLHRVSKRCLSVDTGLTDRNKLRRKLALSSRSAKGASRRSNRKACQSYGMAYETRSSEKPPGWCLGYEHHDDPTAASIVGQGAPQALEPSRPGRGV